jgi:hypothetical protein
MGHVHNTACELVVKLMELCRDHKFYSFNVDMMTKYSRMRQGDV